MGSHALSGFAQDSWKVTRKFTLDYGLRYDYSTYLKEQYGRAPFFSPTTPNPATGNIPGVLQDLTSLMSSFGDGGFTNNVSSRPPLPEAFNSEDNEYRTQGDDRPEGSFNACQCRGDEELSPNRLGQLFKLLGEVFNAKEPAEMMNKLSELFKLLSGNAEDRQTIQNARSNIQFFAGSATIQA